MTEASRIAILTSLVIWIRHRAISYELLPTTIAKL